MSAYTLGVDCHIILNHADVDAGANYGFLCPQDNTVKEEGVQITRRVQSEDTTFADIHAGTMLWIAFDIICADDQRDPDGKKHTKTRQQDYDKICEFLLQSSGITLVTPVGAFTNLGALGYSADERHRPHHSIIKCELNNVGYYFPPVDPDLLALSLWDGTLTWGTSYWR
jgi:hypothetical protein